MSPAFHRRRRVRRRRLFHAQEMERVQHTLIHTEDSTPFVHNNKTIARVVFIRIVFLFINSTITFLALRIILILLYQ